MTGTLSEWPVRLRWNCFKAGARRRQAAEQLFDRMAMLVGGKNRLRPQPSTVRTDMNQNQRAQLIAPCGMDCAVCSSYLAYSHHIPRKRGAISHCAGCRARLKMCAYLKGHCARLANEEVEFCFECSDYPCERLLHLDLRYRTKYGMSLLENLESVRKRGCPGLREGAGGAFGLPPLRRTAERPQSKMFCL